MRFSFKTFTSFGTAALNAWSKSALGRLIPPAQPNLPAEVNQFVLSMRKSTGIPTLIFALYSPQQTHDSLFLANYANININDALYRVPGVGEVRLFGVSDYAMRIWLKTGLLAKLGLSSRM